MCKLQNVDHKTPEIKWGIFPSAHRWFLYLLVFLCFTAFLKHSYFKENSIVKWIFMHRSVVSIKLYISNHLKWWLSLFHRWLTFSVTKDIFEHIFSFPFFFNLYLSTVQLKTTEKHVCCCSRELLQQHK